MQKYNENSTSPFFYSSLRNMAYDGLEETLSKSLTDAQSQDSLNHDLDSMNCSINDRPSIGGTNFSLEVIEIHDLIDEYNNVVDILYLVRAKNDIGETCEVTLSRENLDNKKWVDLKLGATFYARTKDIDSIRREICNSAITQGSHYRSYGSPGWYHHEDKWFYILKDKVIGDPPSTIIASTHCKVVSSNTSINKSDILSHMKIMLGVAPLEITAPLLLFNFMGLIKSVFEHANSAPNFTLFLHGKSGSRKTTLGKLFCCPFDLADIEVPITFISTAKAIEEKMHAYRDAVLLIDDYNYDKSLSKMERNDLNQKLNLVLRLTGEQTAKSRSRNSIHKDENLRPRGLILITGEKQVAGNSNRARCLQLHLPKNKINLSALTDCQRDIHKYGDIMLSFLEFVSSNFEELSKTIYHTFQNERERAQRSMESHGRQITAKAQFMVMIRVLEEFLDCDASFTESLRSSISKAFELDHPDNDDLHSLILKSTLSIFETEGFFSLNDKEERPFGSGNAFVKRDGEYVYITSKVLFDYVKEDIEATLDIQRFSEKTLLECLAERALLKTTLEGSKELNTTRTMFDGKRMRCAAIHLDLLKTISSCNSGGHVG